MTGRGPSPSADGTGLTALRAPAGDGACGWYVRHDPTGLPVGPSLRLRGQARQMKAELLATGIDWAAVRSYRDLTAAVREVAARWHGLAARCCESGEHYSPYTWRAGGRCSGALNRAAR